MNFEKHNAVMPALFISHGSPHFALDQEKAEIYRAWGKTIAKPKAILVFSAHWEGRHLAFGETATHQELMYDFYGFPEALYQLQYVAPGSRWLHGQVKELLTTREIKETDRQLDHGVWVPFLHMWPDADVPVLQMSMPSMLSNQQLYELGKQLAPLREQGVLIAGTGMVTHNLSEWNPRYDGEPIGWAVAFDKWVKQTLLNKDVESLFNWEQAPEARRNHPTPEHFRPMLIAAGAARLQQASFPIEGFDFGILSNRCVQFE